MLNTREQRATIRQQSSAEEELKGTGSAYAVLTKASGLGNLSQHSPPRDCWRGGLEKHHVVSPEIPKCWFRRKNWLAWKHEEGWHRASLFTLTSAAPPTLSSACCTSELCSERPGASSKDMHSVLSRLHCSAAISPHSPRLSRFLPSPWLISSALSLLAAGVYWASYILISLFLFFPSCPQLSYFTTMSRFIRIYTLCNKEKISYSDFLLSPTVSPCL